MPATPVRGTRALLALRRPQEGRGHCWRCGRPEWKGRGPGSRSGGPGGVASVGRAGPLRRSATVRAWAPAAGAVDLVLMRSSVVVDGLVVEEAAPDGAGGA